MKQLLKKNAGILILIIISFSVLSFSDPDIKPGRVKKEQRKECRKQSGSCMVRKQKAYKTPFKYKNLKIRSKRAGR